MFTANAPASSCDIKFSAARRPGSSSKAPATPKTVTAFARILRFEACFACDMGLSVWPRPSGAGGLGIGTGPLARPPSEAGGRPAELETKFGRLVPARFRDWCGSQHGTRGPLFANGGSSSLISVVDCTNQSQVGGRTHETQFGFFWRGGSDAYRDNICDALSRDVFYRRRWQLEVLRQRRS
jgi:hypothetical protein